MLNNTMPDPFILAYIAARRTERTLDRTEILARQWRDCVSIASHEGDDLFAVEALQQAQHYNDTVANLYQRLVAQEAEVARLHVVSFEI